MATGGRSSISSVWIEAGRLFLFGHQEEDVYLPHLTQHPPFIIIFIYELTEPDSQATHQPCNSVLQTPQTKI